ncbi:alpha/beta fold hydrolase [Bacillus sp. FJAT-49711]|uniref:alpha/beta fold hydrolase n=1 Tax=Bacillus sp. FJAT-49711 TaxID=2833585 RepID=UPI001BCA4C75|nr:alpha/beta hydrolase [Bacillus sp. FJAT-49711]MBS4218286.1 alpha/beta fold hydrolase [Bacillus sp. FJAT-49711]
MEDCKSDNKDILLLIHGLALDSSCWGQFPNFLHETFTVIQYDIRSHGKSSTGEGQITWDVLREDLHGLIEKLKLTKVHILAFGYGTYLAVKYALKYTNNVQSLTLMSLPYLAPNNPHFYLAQHVFPYIKDTMKAGHPNFLHPYEELLKGYTTLGSSDNGLKQYFRVLLGYSDEHFSDMVKLTSTPTLLMELPELPCPVLILSGALNVTTPDAFLNASSFLLKNGTRISIPDASFLLFLEQPEVAAKWIHLFVLRHSNTSFSRMDTQMFIQAVFQPEEGQASYRAPILYVQLMSGFRVEIDSVPITSSWQKRHAKRILSYLVFHPITTRDILCEEFFPHLDPDKAKANLKVCMHHLEKMLRHPTISAKGLLFQKGTVSVQYKIKCDLADFLTVVRQAFVEQDPLIRYELCKQLPPSIPETLLADNYDNWAISLRHEIDAQLCYLAEWMKKFQYQKLT